MQPDISQLISQSYRDHPVAFWLINHMELVVVLQILWYLFVLFTLVMIYLELRQHNAREERNELRRNIDEQRDEEKRIRAAKAAQQQPRDDSRYMPER